MSLLIALAFDYAAHQHADQRWLGTFAQPYVNHVADVASRVATATHGKDPVLIAAALLHETIAVAGCNEAEIRDRFGEDVLGLVLESSCSKSSPDPEPQPVTVRTVANSSERARLIRLADMTSDLRAIAMHRPFEDWRLERIGAYLAWATDVAKGCRGLSEYLDNWFDIEAEKARELMKRRAGWE